MNIDRRTFIGTSGLATVGIATGIGFPAFGFGQKMESKRPPLKERKFTSEAVEATIQKVKESIKNPELAWLFENCFPNTLDTTVNFKMTNGKPDTFVITGDINAMWLRDSLARFWPTSHWQRKTKSCAN